MTTFMLISIFKILVQNQDEIARIFFFVMENHVMAQAGCSLISNSLCVINFFLKIENMQVAFIDGENNGI
jgi:hypothetical protein